MSTLPRESAYMPQIFSTHSRARVLVYRLILCLSLIIITSVSAIIVCLLLFPTNFLIITLFALLSIAIGALLLSHLFIYMHERKTSLAPREDKLISPQLPVFISPQLPTDVLQDLNKSTITHLSHTHEDHFFPDFEVWKNSFLRDSEFLLNSALASWNMSPLEKGSFPELYRDYTKFSLILTSNDMQEVASIIRKENYCCIHQLSSETAEKHKISTDSKAVKTVLQTVPFVLPILPEISLDFSTTENFQICLYQIFRNYFTRYYLALNHSISKETTIILRPFSSGCDHPQVRQMQWLALLCAIEQLRFTPTLPQRSTIPTDASSTPIYLLSPEDYWSIFVHRDLFSFSREASYFGLVDHSSTLSYSMSFININRARFVNTHHIVLSDLSDEDIERLTKFSTQKPRPT
ncbi:hypothetical protein BOKEGFJH_00408 [Chlamydia avium]|uniref:DUF58 domain-containing protein n=1 Tax=Chlamydia avium TaxID=1457141 RepID=A0ABN0MRP4_9CHLA|nr:hypothetical protein [Chlamydia avium]EPP38178.1 hypothetical protein CP10881SC42_0833 [Chlamydia avium]VVT42886.1 hypothetical protein BOKEGFJH_00408 [Chlamydia avium]